MSRAHTPYQPIRLRDLVARSRDREQRLDELHARLAAGDLTSEEHVEQHARILAEPVWLNNLLAMRGQHHSQQSIADAAGLRQNTLSAIELGRLSGRRHMDDIARVLNVQPTLIFPYYGLLTFEEAAEHLGVSASLISRRVEDRDLVCIRIGGIRLLDRSKLDGRELRKRPGLSVRARIRELLSNTTDGLTTGDIITDFRPFPSSGDEARAKQTVQSTLSRSPEFHPDKSQDPPRWHLVA